MTGGQIVKLPVSTSTGAAQPLGHQHPADPPAGHREVLGERAEHDRLPRGLPRGAGGPAGRRAARTRSRGRSRRRSAARRGPRTRRRGRRAPRGAASCRSGWRGWPRPGRARRRAPRAARRSAGSGSRVRRGPRRPRSRARSARCGSRGSRAGPSPPGRPGSKAARKASRKPPLEPVVTTTSSAVTSMPCCAPVVPGDRLAELGDPGGDGVAERVAAAQQPHGLVGDRARGARRRLAGDQVDQVAVRALPLGRRGQQVHHVEGRHVRPLGHRAPSAHVADRVTRGRGASGRVPFRR